MRYRHAIGRTRCPGAGWGRWGVGSFGIGGIFAWILGWFGLPLWALEYRFPGDAGVVDVSQAPYHARGDGVSDDTQALQQALLDNPSRNTIIYLPKGVYRIHAPLRWPTGDVLEDRQRSTILMGAGREHTEIRLMDYSPGFEQSSRALSMIWMGEAPAYHFRNAIRHLTLNTGIGNPGASGVLFMANSQGGMWDVDIVAGEATSGGVGLDLSHSDLIGPSLFKNLRILGFDYGVRSAYSQNSYTFENLFLSGQSHVGIRNTGQNMSIRGVVSSNTVPVFQNTAASGVVMLSDVEAHGLPTARPTSAVVNRGFLFLRNLRTTGYTNSVESRAGLRSFVAKQEVPIFVSHPVVHAFRAPHRSLNLPVEETPEAPWDPLDQWASPLAFGGKPDDDQDDSAALQKAIDSGATTIYLPNGTWRLSRPVEFRGKARRLIGCEARIVLDGLGDQPALRVSDGAAPVVWIERLEIVPSGHWFVDQASRRRLVLKSLYDVTALCSGPGDVFIEDVSSPRPWRFKGNQVWARQWHLDFNGDKIVNDGGTLWILGLTTRRSGTLIRTINGGRTELMGGLCISSGPFKQQPMFVIEQAQASFIAGELSYEGTPFQVPVVEQRGQKAVRIQNRGTGDGPRFELQSGGVAMPLYSGFDAEDSLPVP